MHILLFSGYEETELLYVLLVSFLPRYVVNNTFDLVPPRFFCLFEGYDSTVFIIICVHHIKYSQFVLRVRYDAKKNIILG